MGDETREFAQPKEGQKNSPEGVISFERFTNARLQREKLKKIESLKQSLQEAEERDSECEIFLDSLVEKYGTGYEELGERIDDEIIEHQVYLENIQEKLHTKVMTNKPKMEIDEMERELVKWESVYGQWKDLESQIYCERFKLFYLIGEAELRNYYLMLGYEPEDVSELVKQITSSIERDKERLKKETDQELFEKMLEEEGKEDV